MERLDIENRPMCATCGEPILHNGPDWEEKANSRERSAVTAPLVNGQQAETYRNHLIQVASIRRSGGWEHASQELPDHDPAPHDNRTVEQEHDRQARYRETEPDYIKAVRAQLTAKSGKKDEIQGKKPTVAELMSDATPEELEKWNKTTNNKLGQ